MTKIKICAKKNGRGRSFKLTTNKEEAVLYSFRLLLVVAGTILMIVLAVQSVQRAMAQTDGHYWFAIFYIAVAVYFGFRAHQVWQQLKAENLKRKSKE